MKILIRRALCDESLNLYGSGNGGRRVMVWGVLEQGVCDALTCIFSNAKHTNILLDSGTEITIITNFECLLEPHADKDI